MEWYQKKIDHNDIVVSSRVRLARNLVGYPFEDRLTPDKAQEIIGKISAVYEKDGYEKVDFSALSDLEVASYVEKHSVSREFASKKGPHALLRKTDDGLDVMLCEEDHVRIQCILPGFALEEAFRNACRADDLLDKDFEVAFDETLGYLTHCPTNLGTGMRASVMMFLPALTMAGRIEGLSARLSKIGLTMRGLFGEGTAAQGNLYQISNQITLGVTEEDSIAKLSEMVRQISDSERDLRRLISPEKNPELVDKICRSVGILKYAHMLSSEEFLSLYAKARLGAVLGLLPDVDVSILDRLLIEMMPATLSLQSGDKPGEKKRDLVRAALVKKALS